MSIRFTPVALVLPTAAMSRPDLFRLSSSCRAGTLLIACIWADVVETKRFSNNSAGRGLSFYRSPSDAGQFRYTGDRWSIGSESLGTGRCQHHGKP